MGAAGRCGGELSTWMPAAIPMGARGAAATPTGARAAAAAPPLMDMLHGRERGLLQQLAGPSLTHARPTH